MIVRGRLHWNSESSESQASWTVEVGSSVAKYSSNKIHIMHGPLCSWTCWQLRYWTAQALDIVFLRYSVCCSAQVVDILFNICMHNLNIHQSRSTNYSKLTNLSILELGHLTYFHWASLFSASHQCTQAKIAGSVVILNTTNSALSYQNLHF